MRAQADPRQAHHWEAGPSLWRSRKAERRRAPRPAHPRSGATLCAGWPRQKSPTAGRGPALRSTGHRARPWPAPAPAAPPPPACSAAAAPVQSEVGRQPALGRVSAQVHLGARQPSRATEASGWGSTAGQLAAVSSQDSAEPSAWQLARSPARRQPPPRAPGPRPPPGCTPASSRWLAGALRAGRRPCLQQNTGSRPQPASCCGKGQANPPDPTSTAASSSSASPSSPSSPGTSPASCSAPSSSNSAGSSSSCSGCGERGGRRVRTRPRGPAAALAAPRCRQQPRLHAVRSPRLPLPHRTSAAALAAPAWRAFSHTTRSLAAFRLVGSPRGLAWSSLRRRGLLVVAALMVRRA